MVSLKSITCYTENEVIFEGKILMQKENHFEGMIDNDFINAYLYGEIDTIHSSIHVTTITPENYPFHVMNYIAFQENKSNRYFGEFIDTEGDRGLCFISVKNLSMNKQFLEQQIAEMKFIIHQHKETMHERYHEYLQSAEDEVERRRVENQLRKRGKLNYYL